MMNFFSTVLMWMVIGVIFGVGFLCGALVTGVWWLL